MKAVKPTWVKLPAARGCLFSGITKTALFSWFLTMVHQTAGFSSPGAAGASPLETSRTLGLQAEKLDQLCAPTSAAEQEDVQCVLVSVVITDPGSEDCPTQLLEIRGKKCFF